MRTSKYWQVAAVRALMQEKGFKNHLYVDRQSRTIRIKVCAASTDVIRVLFPLCQKLAAEKVDIRQGEFLMWFGLDMTESRAKAHNKIFTLMMSEDCQEKFNGMGNLEETRRKQNIIWERERLQDRLANTAEAVVAANQMMEKALKELQEFNLANS